MNQPLPPELRELERILSSLVPRALSPETEKSLATSCSPDATDEGFDELELHLGQIAPATMRTDVLSRMIKAMDSWHEHVPVEEKVVPFSSQEIPQTQARKKSGGMFAAAAAVALLGAASALVMPGIFSSEIDNGTVTHQQPFSNTGEVTVSSQHDSKQAWLVPDAMSHRVVNSADRGIVMTENQIPHRCIRLDSMDTIKIEDEDGREITIDRPSVQYVLIPVETN